ncbi:MAG TPA: hypothetical protein P5075_08845 [Eubacteriales bacterium]|nr:hypothetical protein [Eubacteriales bacterium]
MRNNNIRFLALMTAFALVFAALPAFALADDAGNIVLYDGSDISDVAETEYLQTANGLPGGDITIYVPIKNTGSGTATELTCSIPVSDDPEAFPFSMSDETATELTGAGFKKVDSTDDNALVNWSADTLLSGEHAYFKVTGTLLSSATSGDKTLTFTITYQYDGTECTDTVQVPIYVRPISASSSGSSSRRQPKVIIESYSFSEDTIYAGDTVTLRLAIANTSSREGITNLQLDLSNDDGVILPAPGGSSSIFIGDIAKSDICVISIDLQIAPDADPKSQLLAIKFTYEGTKNTSQFEEDANVNVPVQQKARVRINDPVVYDDPWVGGSVSVGVTVYNLGKSPLYNCMVDLDADNMTLEEAYFGGNVASGATLRADLTVTPLEGGEITGNVRVTYEDAYGNQTEKLLPLTMYVNEETDEGTSIYVSGSNAVISADDGEDMTTSSGMAWYWWVLIASAVVAAGAVIGVRAKKKRERSLEDL